MFCACVCTSFTIIFPMRNKQRHTSATLTGKHSASYHIYSGQIWRSECMWCGAGQTMTDWTFQSRISSINELPSRHISSQLCVDHRVCWLGLISAGKKGSNINHCRKSTFVQTQLWMIQMTRHQSHTEAAAVSVYSVKPFLYMWHCDTCDFTYSHVVVQTHPNNNNPQTVSVRMRSSGATRLCTWLQMFAILGELCVCRSLLGMCSHSYFLWKSH